MQDTLCQPELRVGSSAFIKFRAIMATGILRRRNLSRSADKVFIHFL